MKQMVIFGWVWSVLFVFGLVGCAGAGSAAAPSGPNVKKGFNGEKWQLVYRTVAGQKRAVIAGTDAWLILQGGKLRGNSGCNHMDGTYAAKNDGSFTSLGFSMTEMACGAPGAMELENDVGLLMGKVTRYVCDASSLTLSDGTDQNVLHFMVAIPPKPLALQGTRWTISGIEESDADSVVFWSGPHDGSGFVEIRAGKVSGAGGVNTFRGSATVGEDGTVSFGPLATTRKAGDPAAMKFESAFLKAMGKATTWSVSGTKLVLSGPEAGPDLIFEGTLDLPRR